MRQGTVLLIVSDGINVSRQETAAIEVNVGSCDDARQQVNDE